MRRLLATFLLAGLAGLSALGMGSCSHKLTGVLIANSGPHTTIFIQGPVDTAGVNHLVHLHWFGTDPHGYIAGYEVRMIDTLNARSDTLWHFTLQTDSIITVYTPTGYSSAVFEARAINDHGVKDPNPARQRFYFRNKPPIVKLATGPRASDHSDTTFASATVTWSVLDVDGDPSKVVCYVWLNGHEDSPVVATGTSFTVPSSQFLLNGTYVSGRRTLYIRGVDDGGMAGPIDSVSWYVKSPVTNSDLPLGRGRLLLIDDVPNSTPSTPAETRADTVYSNAVARTGLPAGTWRVLRLQTNQPFRSGMDLQQTMQQFDAVVWYRGEQTTVSTVMDSCVDGVGPYLDGGGKFMFESLNMVTAWSSAGPITTDFLDRYLNSDGVYLYGLPPDSSASWGFSTPTVFPCPVLSDSLPANRGVGQMRLFKPRSWSQVLIEARAHTLSQDNPYDLALAMAVPQNNGGMLVLDTYPMVTATAGGNQRASAVLSKIFALLGVHGP